MKKGILKRTGQALKRAAAFAIKAGAILSIAIGAKELAVAKEINDTNYKSHEQIEESIDFLNIDKSFTLSSRLKHNGNEPIYYFVAPMDDYKEQAVHDSLYYFESIFKDIDSSYRFKEVELPEFTLRLSLGKTVLYFGGQTDFEENLISSSARGIIYRPKTMFNKDFLHFGAIMISDRSGLPKYNTEDPRSEMERKIEGHFSTTFHEIMHAFGFDDTYEKEGTRKSKNGDPGHFKSTTMYTLNFNQINELAPHDYKLLHAYYNNTDSKEVIEAKVKAYTDAYFALRLSPTKYTKNYFSNFNEIDQKEYNSLEQIVAKRSINDGKTYYESIQIVNDTLIYRVYDKDKNLVNENTAKTQFTKSGVIYVEALSFEDGQFTPGKDYISKGSKITTDFMLYKTQDNTYEFMDINNLSKYEVLYNYSDVTALRAMVSNGYQRAVENAASKVKATSNQQEFSQ